MAKAVEPMNPLFIDEAFEVREGVALRAVLSRQLRFTLYVIRAHRAGLLDTDTEGLLAEHMHVAV